MKKVRFRSHLDAPTKCTALVNLECVRCGSKIPIRADCFGYCTSETGTFGHVICMACVKEDPSFETYLL